MENYDISKTLKQIEILDIVLYIKTSIKTHCIFNFVFQVIQENFKGIHETKLLGVLVTDDRTNTKQAQVGVPHSEIQVELH